MIARIPSWQISLLLIFFVHLFAVWLHGAELLWEVAFITIIIVIAGITLTTGNLDTAPLKKSLWWFFIICGVWLSYLMLTTVSLPIGWVETLSPASIIWHETFSGKSISATLSIAPSVTRLETFEFASLFLLFIITFVSLQQSQKPIVLVYGLILIGVSVSIYGLINHVTDGRYEWVEAIPPWDSPWSTTIRGTFSYKNQFGIYLAMLLPLIVGVIHDQIKNKKHELKRQAYWQSLFLLLSSRICTLALAALIILMVCTQTDSRGAIVALGLSAALMLIKSVFAYKTKKQTPRKGLTYMAIGSIVILIFVNSVSFERFKKFGMEDNGRSQLHSVAKRIVNDYPLVGSGAGTYPLLQHNYKPVSLGNNAMSKRAHSDYLELLATQGIVGAAVLIVIFGLLLVPVFRGRSKHHPSLLAGCQCSLIILIIHSSFDFNYGTYYLPALFLTVIAIAHSLIGLNEGDH